MDLHSLRRLAVDGFSGYPATHLGTLGVWCGEWCEASGDGRFCILADALRELSDWWEQHDERGGVPKRLALELESQLKTYLTDVIGAGTAADGAVLASILRSEIRSLLLPPSEWRPWLNDPDLPMKALPVEEALFLHKAVVSEPPRSFTFASGLESPVYVDSRRLISYPSERDRIVTSMTAAAREHFAGTNAVVGIATGAIAWAAWLAAELELPLLYARGAAKDRGLGRLLEGELPEHARALVVEDLVTTGGSCLKAVDALQAEGAACSGVLSLFSYELPFAREVFAQRGVTHFSLGTLSGLLTIVDSGLSDEAVRAIEQWRDTVLPDFRPKTD